MDPNETLARMLAEARIVIDAVDQGGFGLSELDRAEQLAEHVLALDHWLSQGSFLPDRWNKQ